MHRLTCGISFLFRSVNLILFTLLLVHLPTLRITGEVIFTYKQDKKDDRSRKSENFTSRRGSVLLRSHLAPTSNGLGSDLSTCSQMLRQTMTNRWCCNLLMYLMTTASARKMTHTNKTNYTQWFVTLFILACSQLHTSRQLLRSVQAQQTDRSVFVHHWLQQQECWRRKIDQIPTPICSL